MLSPVRRLVLGVAAVALLAALCLAAVWSVRGRLGMPPTAHAQETGVPAGLVDEAQIQALQDEVARLRRERDDARERIRELEAVRPPVASQPLQAPARQAPAHVATPLPSGGGFGEAQTFSTLSTSQ